MIYERLSSILSIPHPVVIECGAWQGDDSVKLREAMRGGMLYCFEPDKRNFPNLVLKSITHQFIALPYAIGDVCETVPWFSASFDRSSSLNRPTGHLQHWPHISFDQREEVQCITLDSLFDCMPRVDLIWADIQGAQEKLIRGARKTLERTRYLYIECCDTRYYEGELTTDEVLATLGDGWEIDTRDSADALLVNRRFQCT